jgi:Ca2+-binding RTX toxin-like protein
LCNAAGLFTPLLYGRRTQDVRKKLTILGATVLMLATMLALCGVAQAAPVDGKADAKCLAEAVRTLGPGFNPADYNFVGGTEGADDLTYAGTGGADVFCGFGGDDYAPTLVENDVFLGGAGEDNVYLNGDTFYGGEGNNTVGGNHGTFYGGAGEDSFDTDLGGTFVQ